MANPIANLVSSASIAGKQAVQGQVNDLLHRRDNNSQAAQVGAAVDAGAALAGGDVGEAANVGKELLKNELKRRAANKAKQVALQFLIRNPAFWIVVAIVLIVSLAVFAFVTDAFGFSNNNSSEILADNSLEISAISGCEEAANVEECLNNRLCDEGIKDSAVNRYGEDVASQLPCN